jgi:hypothetical protein
MSRPQIDVLTFAGCPHAQPALALVERLVSELELEASIHRVDVTISSRPRRTASSARRPSG